MTGRRIGLVVASTLSAACAAVPGGPGPEVAPAASSATVWNGVYTVGQAARGAVAYTEACSSCHAADLRGSSNAPSLVGVSFLFLWENRSLEELFTVIRTQMPTNAPNSLPAATYVDVLSYILEANGFPTGAEELSVDDAALERISIVARASAAPR